MNLFSQLDEFILDLFERIVFECKVRFNLHVDRMGQFLLIMATGLYTITSWWPLILFTCYVLCISVFREMEGINFPLFARFSLVRLLYLGILIWPADGIRVTLADLCTASALYVLSVQPPRLR